MNKKGKNIFYLLTFGFLAWHFFATMVFCLPDKYFPSTINFWTKKYMNPAFNQGWMMFAPNPPSKEKWMEYRWAQEGHWNDWHRADTIVLREFHQYRLTYHNRLELMIQNSAAHLWGEAWKAGQMADQFYQRYEGDSIAYLKESPGYVSSIHLASKLMEHFEQVDISQVDSIDIRLILKDPFVSPNRNQMDTIIYDFPTRCYR